LTNEEAEKMTAELGSILKHVEQLASLDTSGVEPAAGAKLGPSAWRPDVVVPGLSHDDALAQAPRSAEEGFAVPAFVDGSQERT
jgi:aspartyl-tRNA(Asn)/glutamyl-tRNA(Gln) amidotransferase subunit C